MQTIQTLISAILVGRRMVAQARYRYVRSSAACALLQLQEHAAPAVAELAAALKDENANVRINAARVLVQLKQHAVHIRFQ